MLTEADTQTLDAAIGTWLPTRAEATEPADASGTTEGDDGGQAPLVAWSADGVGARVIPQAEVYVIPQLLT